VKLYICYGFLQHVRTTGRPGGHPCGNALHALEQAGHAPEVEVVHGLGLPPLDRTAGRKKVKEITGQTVVPVLVTDDGEAIYPSKKIIAWAQAHPVS
jgi:hypothetical protein